MQTIEGILFEPVGCLAEFPVEPFQEIAARLFGRRKQASRSGSRSYWHLLNLMEAVDQPMEESARKMAEMLELQAVAAADAYEDVLPALSELKQMGVQLLVASSLSEVAVAAFLKESGTGEFFSGVWSRDTAGGIKAAPLLCALPASSLPPDRAMFLTDTAEGLKVAAGVGVHPILMMNDPDDARRLAQHNPAGGIVSLHELPDFIRLVAAENARPRSC